MKALLVTYSDWFGPCRLPRALKRAGWDVGILCKKGSLSDLTRHYDWKAQMTEWSEFEILRSILAAIKEFGPDVLIPAEPAIIEAFLEVRRLLETGKIQGIDDASAGAIRASTFPVRVHPLVRSKIDLLEALKLRGVQIAPQRELFTLADAESFVGEHEYPVLLKPDEGFAGKGIQVCKDEDELVGALAGALKPGKGRLAIQKHLGSQSLLQEFVAKDGKILARLSVFRVRVFPEPFGPISVARAVENPQVDAAMDQMAELLNYNGYCAAQFMTSDEGRGESWFIEANARISPFTHTTDRLGVDLGAALLAAFKGEAVREQRAFVGETIALYPQEVVRDPDSEFLKGLRDSIEDDPELAMKVEEGLTKVLAAR